MEKSIGVRDFDTKTIKLLSKKGVTITGIQSVPADENDVYFTETAYLLNANGQRLIRRYSQVITMAVSSWMPE